MEVVANFLQKEAQTRTDTVERDYFGRTAFNRYYYAVFLKVRNELTMIDSKWSVMAHASMPELLRGSIMKALKQGNKEALRNSDQELIQQCTHAIASVEALAKLLEEGRTTRVTADYHPEIAVDFTTKDNFKLNAIAVRDAKSWPHKAQRYIETIILAWKQINA